MVYYRVGSVGVGLVRVGKVTHHRITGIVDL